MWYYCSHAHLGSLSQKEDAKGWYKIHLGAISGLVVLDSSEDLELPVWIRLEKHVAALFHEVGNKATVHAWETCPSISARRASRLMPGLPHEGQCQVCWNEGTPPRIRNTGAQPTYQAELGMPRLLCTLRQSWKLSLPSRRLDPDRVQGSHQNRDTGEVC